LTDFSVEGKCGRISIPQGGVRRSDSEACMFFPNAEAFRQIVVGMSPVPGDCIIKPPKVLRVAASDSGGAAPRAPLKATREDLERVAGQVRVLLDAADAGTDTDALQKDVYRKAKALA